MGRPPVFKSVQDLQNKIDEYFFFIQGEYDEVDGVDEIGNATTVKNYSRNAENPSLTGLALYLGFESRQSVYDYEKNGDFSYTIKRARLRVECAYEQALLSKNSTGAIFALKNFGWSDKLDVTSDIKITAVNIKDLVKFE